MSQLHGVIILLSFIITTSTNVTFTEASSRLLHNQRKHHSAVVLVGSVYCDTSCSQHPSTKPTPAYYISGALVAVECAGINKEATKFTKQVKTNEHGEFQVHLPPFPSLNKIKKGCSVKLITSNDVNCAVASPPTPTTLLHIKPNMDKKQTILSAGLFSFKPSKHPQLCNQKMSKTQFGFFPPNPLILPPSIFPPIIPSPPSSIFPPLVPSPPPSIFPPILPSPPSPPPSLFPPISFPPVPGFTPASPPPPPPSPTFPIPLPPFPFPLPPVPVFPGIPPAATSSVFP